MNLPGPKARVRSPEVLAYIKSCGGVGRTNPEIARHFQMNVKQVTDRISYLSRNGLIKWNGKSRALDGGHATDMIWVAA